MGRNKVYYAAYDRSREKRMEFAGGLCEICGSDESIQCHHRGQLAYILDNQGKLTYKHVLIVCEECHKGITKMEKAREAKETRDARKIKVLPSTPPIFIRDEQDRKRWVALSAVIRKKVEGGEFPEEVPEAKELWRMLQAARQKSGK